MKNSIFIIFFSIVFGFSNISQHMQDGRWFWDTYFARQVHRLFNFPSNSEEAQLEFVKEEKEPIVSIRILINDGSIFKEKAD